MQNIIDIILDDIRIDLTDEFDRNFERKGFFDNRWQQTKKPNTRGSLMLRSSALRNSIQSSKQGFRLVWKSSVPYAGIHNEGGKINRVSSKGKAYTINMPQRQFIGTSPETEQIITDIIDEHLPNGIDEYINNLFNQDQ